MIVITNAGTPETTRAGIVEYLDREAARYRRDAERERSPARKSKDVARSAAISLAAEMLREARLET
jgi:hypothetical protein